MQFFKQGIYNWLQHITTGTYSQIELFQSGSLLQNSEARYFSGFCCYQCVSLYLLFPDLYRLQGGF